jgi:PKD repeat protein
VGEGPVIKNTIIADNSGPPSDQGPDVSGSVRSEDYNVVEHPGGHTMTGPTGNSIIGGDPRLGPLASNGGETQTRALQPDSPAIDAGSCSDVAGSEIALDQRGIPRPQGVTCDIGAFELGQPSLVLVAVPEIQAVGNPVQLTATAVDELGQPMPGIPVVFEVSPLGEFAGGGTVVTVPTDGAGEATVTLNSASAGTTTVRARSDAGGQDSVSVVFSEPVDIANLRSNSPVVLGETMHFTASVSGTGPMTYTWGFGGDGTGGGQETATPTYIYGEAGTYTVTLVAENAVGADEAALVVEVCEPVEILDLTSDSPVELGETMHFTASVSGTEPITYSWDFDSDGTPELEQMGASVVTYVYSEPRTYTTTLTAVGWSLMGPYADTKSLSIIVEPLRLFLPFVTANHGAP